MRQAAGPRLVLLALGLVLVITWAHFGVELFVPALRAPHWPDPAYWVAARLAAEGHADRIYAGREVFARESVRLGTVPDVFEANVPATVLIFLPLAAFSETAARSIWDVAMLGCLILACWALLRALALPLAPRLGVWALVPMFQPWLENIKWGQAYPLILALLVLGALGMSAAAVGEQPTREPSGEGRHRGRVDVAAGVAYGLIAVVKLYYGALLVAPALVALRGRLLAAAAGVAALAAAVTVWLWGADLWTRALGFALSWHDRPEVALTAYQTLNSWLAHLLSYDAALNREPVANLPGLATVLWWVGAGLLGGASILVLRRARTYKWSTPAQALLAPALVVPLGPVLAPIAEDYHFVLTMFPLLVAGTVLWEVYRRGPMSGAHRPRMKRGGEDTLGDTPTAQRAPAAGRPLHPISRWGRGGNRAVGHPQTPSGEIPAPLLGRGRLLGDTPTAQRAPAVGRSLHPLLGWVKGRVGGAPPPPPPRAPAPPPAGGGVDMGGTPKPSPSYFPP
jgi:hypothetical protein